MAALRPDFDELVAQLEPTMASSWIELGMCLGVSNDTMETIKREEQDVTNQVPRMLRGWMSDNPEGGWSDIVKALRAMKHHALARDIQHKYIDKGMYDVREPHTIE